MRLRLEEVVEVEIAAGIVAAVVAVDQSDHGFPENRREFAFERLTGLNVAVQHDRVELVLLNRFDDVSKVSLVVAEEEDGGLAHRIGRCLRPYAVRLRSGEPDRTICSRQRRHDPSNPAGYRRRASR